MALTHLPRRPPRGSMEGHCPRCPGCMGGGPPSSDLPQRGEDKGPASPALARPWVQPSPSCAAGGQSLLCSFSALFASFGQIKGPGHRKGYQEGDTWVFGGKNFWILSNIPISSDIKQIQ